MQFKASSILSPPVFTWCSQRSTINLWLCLRNAPLMMKSTQVWPSVSNEIEFWSTTRNFHCKAEDTQSMFYSYLDFIEFHVSRMTDNTTSVSVGFTWVNKAKSKTTFEYSLIRDNCNCFTAKRQQSSRIIALPTLHAYVFTLSHVGPLLNRITSLCCQGQFISLEFLHIYQSKRLEGPLGIPFILLANENLMCVEPGGCYCTWMWAFKNAFHNTSDDF